MSRMIFEDYMDEDLDYLMHYGTPRHSGRYPWGSGDNPYQHSGQWLAAVNDMRKAGMSERDIAAEFNLGTINHKTGEFRPSSDKLRAMKSIAKAEDRAEKEHTAATLKDKGYSNMEIGRRMGINESSVRNLLNPTLKARNDRTQVVANALSEKVKDAKYVDVGEGVERQLGCSKQKLKTAIAMLETQGYHISYVKVEQQTNPGKFTSIKVLSKDDGRPQPEQWKDLNAHKDQIKSFNDTWIEDGTTIRHMKPPVSISSDRVKINYATADGKGGKERDGLIQINPNAEDLSLGGNRYCQVRIAVDGTHYLKGMAVYGDPKIFPKGTDIIFNTNKTADKTKMEVLKPLKEDQDNPFGATVRQRDYIGKDGKKHQSPINIVNEDKDWEKWSKNLPSQFLSKQSLPLAKQQLAKRYSEKKKEFEDIQKLTNPTVKKQLLESFADDCDSAAVDLKAAALPRQATHVILPVPSLKDTEVYAPNYKNGEEVVLVRFPYAGPFESPRLRVNNNNKEAQAMMGPARRAIGINTKVAEKLSGADFDGDTVIVIPTKGAKIKTADTLPGLKDFDPSEKYPAYSGMPKVGPKTGFNKGMEMGKASNLITDMTLGGATSSEIERAVRYSMVVIDAEKHNLNWRQAYIDNGIAQLKTKYQGGPRAGAATLISLAKSPATVPERANRVDIDPKTGEKVFKDTGRTYFKYKKQPDGSYLQVGKEQHATTSITKMEKALQTGDHDAHALSSGTRMENVYADHANRMHGLANAARKEYLATPDLKYSPSAKKAYAKEVASLDAKLNVAMMNAPKERQAQLLADKDVTQKLKSNPELDKDQIKRLRAQTLEGYRARVGASGKNSRIVLTDKEWEAIQAGAISNNKLKQIIMKTDQDRLKQLATPREQSSMTSGKIARAESLLAQGKTYAEIADSLGVSVSTLQKALYKE